MRKESEFGSVAAEVVTVCLPFQVISDGVFIFKSLRYSHSDFWLSQSVFFLLLLLFIFGFFPASPCCFVLSLWLF